MCTQKKIKFLVAQWIVCTYQTANLDFNTDQTAFWN